MCEKWFWAENEQGSHPGFLTQMILQRFEGGEVAEELTLTIPPEGLRWMLFESDDYKAIPLLPDAYKDAITCPVPVEWTGCEGWDITFVYKLKQLPGGVPISLGTTVLIGDVPVEYMLYLDRGGDPCGKQRAYFPWDLTEYSEWCSRVGEHTKGVNPDDPGDSFTSTVTKLSPSQISVFVERVKHEVLFSSVRILRRYGRCLYLSGEIKGIVASDEICVYYSRPGDTDVRNLKSDTSDYLYFKDASGSYDLGANNRYIEFERAGYHWLQIWDVSGDCETLLKKRAEWLTDIKLPRFQYQVVFDLENPDIVDSLYLLQAEYAKYEAAGSWFINHDEPDCFTQIQPINTPEDDTPQSGWLSLGVEFGESPCAPIPYYLCPQPTPQTQYWRGECSCDHFRDTLQPLGIPCSHLIAAMKWYSGEPAWSDYVQCP